MPKAPWNIPAKRKAPRAAKSKDRRPDGDRLRDRVQRIERARLMECEAEREAFLGHERNAERLSHRAVELRDAAP